MDVCYHVRRGTTSLIPLSTHPSNPMTFKEFTRAIAYHTQEDRLGSYFKSIASFIAIAICFVWALYSTLKAFVENMTTVTYKVFTAITAAYRSLAAMISGLLDAYHSIPTYKQPEREHVVTQALAG